MPSTNDPRDSDSSQGAVRRGPGHPPHMRKITVRPDRREEIDVQHLARALLRLAQQQYDAAFSDKEQRSPSLDTPVSGPRRAGSPPGAHAVDPRAELNPSAACAGDGGQ